MAVGTDQAERDALATRIGAATRLAARADARLTGAIDRDVFTIRPGIVWKIPPQYIFNAKGRWLIGLGTRISYGSDGADYGISAKLRGSFDFKNWWRSKFRKDPK